MGHPAHAILAPTHRFEACHRHLSITERPCGSVVKHFLGKEGIACSIHARGTTFKNREYFGVGVVELVDTPDCDSGPCEFESRRSPQSILEQPGLKHPGMNGFSCGGRVGEVCDVRFGRRCLAFVL